MFYIACLVSKRESFHWNTTSVKISAISSLPNNSDFFWFSIPLYKNYKLKRTPVQLLEELCICSGTFVFHLSVCLNCILSLIYVSHLHSNLKHTDAVSLAIIHMTLCDFIWHCIKVNHNLVNGNKHQGGWVLLWMKTNEGREMSWLCTLWNKRAVIMD